MIPHDQLAQHTKDEMLRTVAWELIFGSMDPESAERRIHSLLQEGAHLSTRPTFERTADAALEEVRAIYSQRGQEYADSWSVEHLVFTLTASTLARFGIQLTDEQMRLLQLAALCDVKDQRIAAGGPFKKDSFIDGLAYRASYTTLRDEYERANH